MRKEHHYFHAGLELRLQFGESINLDIDILCVSESACRWALRTNLTVAPALIDKPFEITLCTHRGCKKMKGAARSMVVKD